MEVSPAKFLRSLTIAPPADDSIAAVSADIDAKPIADIIS